MNTTSQTESTARRSAANISDPLSRAALAEQFRQAAAMIEATLGGLDDARPDGQRVSVSVAAQLGSALLSLRLAADRIEAGAVYAPAAVQRPENDLVDESPRLYAYTADQLTARDEAHRLAGFRAAIAAQNVLVQA